MTTTRDQDREQELPRQIVELAQGYAIALIDGQELPAEGVSCKCQACGARLGNISNSEGSDDPCTILTTSGDVIPDGEVRAAGSAGVAFAMFGNCAFCGVRHWFLEVELNSAGVDAALDQMAVERDWDRQLIAPGRPDDPVWEVLEQKTPTGIQHVHSIGPMLIPESVSAAVRNGPTGKQMLPFWQYASTCLAAFAPKIDALQRILERRKALLDSTGVAAE